MPKQRPGLPDPSEELLDLVARVDDMMSTEPKAAAKKTSKIVKLPPSNSKNPPLKINLAPAPKAPSVFEMPVADIAKKLLGHEQTPAAAKPVPALPEVKSAPELPHAKAKKIESVSKASKATPPAAAAVSAPEPPAESPVTAPPAPSLKLDLPVASIDDASEAERPDEPQESNELPSESPVSEPSPGAQPEADVDMPRPLNPSVKAEENDSLGEPADDKTDTTPFDDRETDKAVDEIVARESDTILALEDAKNNRFQPPPTDGWQAKFKNWFHRHKYWLVPLVFIVLVFSLPATRYHILGVFIKEPVAVTIIDGKTDTPVSNVSVSIAGATTKTDANGVAHVRATVGQQTITITKRYYRSISSPYFVGLKSGQQLSISLTATGRLVPVTVTNRLTGKPLANVEISVLNTTAKTNANGQASIALPANAVSDTVQLHINGYNTISSTLQVTDAAVKANTFALTPSGHVYFLANDDGTLDVIKTDLDGGERKVVLAGTGSEQVATTTLLASRDWRYVVLKARRQGDHPTLYMIDTSSDKVTEFDDSSANFTLIGWDNHNFIYDLTRNGQPNWQAANEQLKSYDADNAQLNQLDQTQAEGNSTAYADQHFANFYVINHQLVYNSLWSGYGENASDLGSKTDAIRAVQSNGQNKKDYQTFPAATTGPIQVVAYQPQGLYYAVTDSSNNKTTYYKYFEQTVQSDGVDQTVFAQAYPTYIVSPTGNKTVWSQIHANEVDVYSGDQNANNPKQLTDLTGFIPYGWYGNNYLLLRQNNGLYIVPSTGNGGQPFRISDYVQSGTTTQAYGYGSL